ncbi:MAG: LysM peptidoglycan-binding domain-containing protein, partial [Sulfurovum sp.]|nr:LysM peptidoglycan-binding domain-containing protein [Sulfurovaceae bacterium]
MISLFNQLSAKGTKIVDCRLISHSTTECKPYSTKFLRTKEILDYEKSTKLIIVKNLPLPIAKTSKIEVVSVEDMIDRYVKIHDPIRFSTYYTHEDLQVIARINQKNLQAKKYPRYSVKRGDSLSTIAKRYNISSDNILEWNNIKNISLLKPSQQIIIPINKSNFISLTKKY